MILKVGLTGGTASGKSTVARLLGEMGCLVIDADAVVHDLYRPGEPGYEALLKRFGPEVLQRDGTVNRAWLAALFSDPVKTAELNALIHPLVIAREKEMLAQHQERAGNEDLIAVVEATLLLESGGRERYDRIVVVETSPEVRIERAVKRGMDPADARRRIERQMDSAKRLAMADYVIRNDGDIAHLAAQTAELYQRLMRDLAGRP